MFHYLFQSFPPILRLYTATSDTFFRQKLSLRGWPLKVILKCLPTDVRYMQLCEGNSISGHLLVEKRYRGFNDQVNNSILFFLFVCLFCFAFVFFFIWALSEGKSALPLHPEFSLKFGIQLCFIFCYCYFTVILSLLVPW